MYKIIAYSLFFFVSCAVRLYGQSMATPLPSSTIVPHHLIAISYNTTTVLVFPAAVRPVDRGDQDILAQKQPGADNVLKLKAARKNFPLTNLHVFTADGRIYAFDVIYTDSLASTHDLTALPTRTPAGPSENPVQLTGESVNTEAMTAFLDSLRCLPPLHHGPVNRHDKMTFRLQRIGFAGSLFFFRFEIANHSNLDYTIDFLRMYIRDRQRAKRTSVQEHEMTPVFLDSLSIVPGKATCQYVLVIPAFTLTAGKQFLVEAYEKNGGRIMTLNIRNKYLFKASKL
ncbi:MAG TPA: conjugative transposon protein TraN [Puia sp.]|uniref:conjugative transposon protein TraN n=1 Tax=Puia sp. TaxID=2045100 RepID=UPI002C3A4CFD|nr:conjugative transposon protein TraN [Puia sp.]HVU97741.1 conjugative transposon protein TraN [Puia sp.]